MDEFAQSREDDDLFADDFEPASEFTVEDPRTSTLPAATPLQSEQEQKPSESRGPPSSAIPQAGRIRERQERRGGGGGTGGSHRGTGRGSGGICSSASQYTSEPNSQVKNFTSSPLSLAKAPTLNTITSDPVPDVTPVSNPKVPSQLAPHSTSSDPPRTPAVRGDRSLTGGPSKVKLTEAELSAKLEKMRILNASKIEKHRLQVADQAAFQHRNEELSKELREKEKRERAQRGEMENERSKNRDRKMKGMGSREWDLGKEESDIVYTRRARTSEYVRDGRSGVKVNENSGIRDFNEAPQLSHTKKGRGSHNNRRGSLGGRGGRSIRLSDTEDFPSLSTQAKLITNSAISISVPPNSVPAHIATSSPASPPEPAPGPKLVIEGKSSSNWAEEMTTVAGGANQIETGVNA